MYLALSQSIWVHQLVEPRLFFTAKLAIFSLETGLSTCAQPVNPTEAELKKRRRAYRKVIRLNSFSPLIF